MRFALKVAYLGSSYLGWQRQPHVVTVEGTLLRALTKTKVLTDLKKGKYGYSSRTDSFVHSLSQVVAFSATKDPNIWHINDLLPPDVCVLSISHVHPSFHPRFEFKQKTYRYLAPYQQENLNNMRKAAKFLEGTHDFSSFVKTTSNRSTVTTITSIDISKKEATLIFDFSSNRGFFWQQVRRMVTFFILCGQGEISPDETLGFLKMMRLPKLPPASPHRLILLDISFAGVFFEPFPKASIKFRRYLESEAQLSFTPPEIIKEFKNYMG